MSMPLEELLFIWMSLFMHAGVLPKNIYALFASKMDWHIAKWVVKDIIGTSGGLYKQVLS